MSGAEAWKVHVVIQNDPTYITEARRAASLGDDVLLYKIQKSDVEHPDFSNRLQTLSDIACLVPLTKSRIARVRGWAETVDPYNPTPQYWLAVQDFTQAAFSVDQVMKCLDTPPQITEPVLSGYVFSLLKVLHVLQARGIPCTINPATIVIDANGWAVLTDLRGLLPTAVGASNSEPAKGHNTVYAAPEWLRDKEHTPTSSAWSLGMALLTLATGSESFAISTSRSLRNDKGLTEVLFGDAVNFSRLSGLCQAFIKACLKVDWAERAGIDRLVSEQFLSTYNAHNRARWRMVIGKHTVGEGAYGAVWQGYEELFDGTKLFVALKKQNNETCANSFEREASIHGKLLKVKDHPNLVTYKGTTTELAMEGDRDRYGRPIFVYKTVVVMEWVEHQSLIEYLQDRSPYKICVVAVQLLNGLSIMHELRVVHRDIKVENILWDGKHAKLTDFGAAKHLENTYADTQTGTPDYMAPEVLTVDTLATFESDIWSFAMTMIALLGWKQKLWPESALPQGLKGQQRPPNDDPRIRGWMQQIYEHIMSPGWAYPIPESLPADLRDFLACCLRPRPADRPTAKQLLEHPYIVKVQAELQQKTMQQAIELRQRLLMTHHYHAQQQQIYLANLQLQMQNQYNQTQQQQHEHQQQQQS